MAKKGGKYAHVIGTLPNLPGVEESRKDLMAQLQEEITAPLAEGEDPNRVDPADRVRIIANGEDPDPAERIRIIEANVRQLLKAKKRAAAGKDHAAEFGRVYAELRAIKARFDEWEASLNLLIEAYELLMIGAMENEGTSSMRLTNGQLISTWKEPNAVVEDKEAFRRWCIKNGLGNKLQLWPSTTNALCKEMLLEGKATIHEDGTVTPAPMPDGIKMYALTKVRLGSE